MSRKVASLVLLGLLFGACDRPVTDVTQAVRPSYTFTNGPAELPQVLRSGGRIISAFADVERDLLVLVGSPEDPTQDRICGGTEPRQFVPVQWVGDFDDVVKQLALLDGISILVYAPIPPDPFVAMCLTAPIAAGSGHFVRSDNDFFGVFGRANAVMEQVHGLVTLQSGGLANVSARFYALGNPDGVLQRFETTVQLVPIAKPE